MKHLTKISSIVATLALVFGLSFTAAMAQTTQNTNTRNTYSQQNTLSGIVVDSQSGQAIANAKVILISSKNMQNNSMKNNKYNVNNNNNNMRNDTTYVNNNNMRNDTTYVNNNNMMGSSQNQLTATTGKNGQFKIQNIPTGIYTIKVKANGYKTWQKQATINNNAGLTIKLKPSQK